MKKIFILLFSAIIMLNLTACAKIEKSNSEPNSEQTGEYLSINYITKEEKNKPSGLTMNIIKYDCDSEEILQIATIPYTAKYPQAVYYELDNAIYFSGKDEGAEKNDQLYKYDLKTKETIKLSENLYEIEKIIPRSKDILLMASIL